ncbi:MAG: hypothetical protein UH850_11425 [Paludibacteraceae bacterium]|nr:hypothetical protein [Paludibacteraceae bacterium]
MSITEVKLMGFELNNGTLYMMDSNGVQSEFGDMSYGDIEIDTLSPNEMPDIVCNLNNMESASFSSEITFADLSCLDYKPFELTKNFNIEYDVQILVQAKWHKKKRINKKWLKRYGMKSDTVKMKAVARTLSYNTETGECEFEVDKLEYIWRLDQKRKNLNIEM